jgi:RNA polymerase sigma factor (sigma-70 family)
LTSQNVERSLLLSVSKGDETAFRQLFENWYRFLASHIFRIAGNRELTEEIVQDVFLKIWLTRETLADVRDFRAYLIIVSRNHALNALRKVASDSKEHRRWLREVDKEEAPDPVSFYYSIIDEAIDRLSPRQREIYLLHRHQRVTYHEIAARLNISRETVKTHLQSAMVAISKYVRGKIDILVLFLFFLKFFR